MTDPDDIVDPDPPSTCRCSCDCQDPANFGESCGMCHAGCHTWADGEPRPLEER